MTMPTLEPEAWFYRGDSKGHGWSYIGAKPTFMCWSGKVLNNSPLFTESQLQQAYAAGLREAVPEGWQLVPIDPTDAMIEAGDSTHEQMGIRDPTVHVWEAMLAAARRGE